MSEVGLLVFVVLLNFFGNIDALPKCVLHPGAGLHSVQCSNVGAMHELAVHMQANWQHLSIVNSPTATFTHTGIHLCLFVCLRVCVLLFF